MSTVSCSEDVAAIGRLTTRIILILGDALTWGGVFLDHLYLKIICSRSTMLIILQMRLSRTFIAVTQA